MDWQSDVSAGEWLRERLTWEGPSMHAVVPRGFAAYARVFHPPTAEAAPGLHLPSGSELGRLSVAENAELARQIVTTAATWQDAADAFDTRMHPLAQWQRLVRAQPGEDWNLITSPDGRRWNAPETGAAPAELTAAIVRTLTAGSDATGFVALWDGFGGLLGGYGSTGRVLFSIDEESSDGTDPDVAWRHHQMLNASTRDPFNNVFQQPTWTDGILPRDVSEGPRLELPERSHVLFAGDLTPFCSPDWILQVPWRDTEGEAHGFAPHAQTPSIMWPADRSWVVVSEIDFDSTIVAGSRAAVDALLQAPTLEVHEIPAEAQLHWHGDSVNP